MKWQVTWVEGKDVMISEVKTHEMLLAWLAQKIFHTFPYMKIQLGAR